jgi:hypothetical protein
VLRLPFHRAVLDVEAFFEDLLQGAALLQGIELADQRRLAPILRSQAPAEVGAGIAVAVLVLDLLDPELLDLGGIPGPAANPTMRNKRAKKPKVMKTAIPADLLRACLTAAPSGSETTSIPRIFSLRAASASMALPSGPHPRAGGSDRSRSPSGANSDCPGCAAPCFFVAMGCRSPQLTARGLTRSFPSEESPMSPTGALRTCRRGHRYHKSTDCPTCPVCEAARTPEGPFAALGAPARRALEQAGIDTVAELSKHTEKAIIDLHGMGPASLPALRAMLGAAGLSFRK